MSNEPGIDQPEIDVAPGVGAGTGVETTAPSFDELVKLVTDKVYAMMLEDLRIENERRRTSHRRL